MRISVDRAGAVASAICAVHCGAVGLLLGVLPVIGLEILHDIRIERAFLLTAAILGAWAALAGYRRHRVVWPVVLLAVGLGLISIAHVSIHARSGEAHAFEPMSLVSACGGLLLVAFHVVNARLRRRCACPACRDDGSSSSPPTTQTA